MKNNVERNKVKERVIDLIASSLEIDKKDISEDTNLTTDLDFESLDLVDLVVAFEDEYGVEIPDKDIKTLQTVKDIIDYIVEHK